MSTISFKSFKSPKVSALVLTTAFAATPAIASESNIHQTDIIRNTLSVGTYPVVAKKDYVNTKQMRVADILQDKAQGNGHFELVIQPYPNAQRESDRNKKYKYFADNIAYPVTYVSNAYEGNKKLQEKVGYTLQRSRSGRVPKDRLVVTGGYVFIITDWNSKDDYEIETILKVGDNTASPAANSQPQPATQPAAKSGLGGFLGALSKGITGGLSGLSKPSFSNRVDIADIKSNVLQPYLDQATSKQQVYYQQWIQNPNNVRLVQHLEDKHKLMLQAMRDYNTAIFNSPEYQRMLAHNRWMDNNINMTVVNNTGATIYVGSTKEAFITHELSPGSSSTENCNTDLYYYHSKVNGTPGTLVNSSDNNCGGTVTIP